METSCGLCHLPLNPDDTTNWKEVRGWVGGPKQDSMRLRTDTGPLAHDACVRAAAAGQVPGSADLFDERAAEGESAPPDPSDPVNEFFKGD